MMPPESLRRGLDGCAEASENDDDLSMITLSRHLQFGLLNSWCTDTHPTHVFGGVSLQFEASLWFLKMTITSHKIRHHTSVRHWCLQADTRVTFSLVAIIAASHIFRQRNPKTPAACHEISKGFACINLQTTVTVIYYHWQQLFVETGLYLIQQLGSAHTGAQAVRSALIWTTVASVLDKLEFNLSCL